MTERAAALALVLAMLSLPVAAMAQSAGEGTDAALELAARQAAERLGVEYLGMQPVEHQGRRLAAVRVMEPGGNANTAFLVQTLMVDPESGEVVGVFPGVNDRMSDFPAGIDASPVERGSLPAPDDDGGG